ncbi:hypothetical protein [Streptomyces sp. NRRL F-5650]|uniref:hypothetical protein n=1 Tax=Streptomyces sp. NRRL F-5650 TaxID=1463868 RepID=UPI0004CADC27|nr:hypothetical protein [Streptomyces sp. NRRL F-5650]
MTHPSDPLLVDAMWRAADLTRAYLAQDRSQIAACLRDLDTSLLERIAGWLVLDHDQLFVRLGEPTMSVSRLKDAAALAPAETSVATSTAIHRAAAGETALTHALEGLALPDQIHALTICIVVMLLEAHGRTNALVEINHMTADYEQRGYPRPYLIT